VSLPLNHIHTRQWNWAGDEVTQEHRLAAWRLGFLRCQNFVFPLVLWPKWEGWSKQGKFPSGSKKEVTQTEEFPVKEEVDIAS
jgi:hypothetical protein